MLVPKAVRADLFKRRWTKDRLRFLFESCAFFQRCDGCEKGTVEFLLAERTREGARDRGEVEAVVQASPWGRELAARDDLEFHGTLWVLNRFHELDLLSSTALRDCFASLRRRGTRLPWHTVNKLLIAAGQQPL